MTIFEISDLIGFQENSIRSAIYRLKETGLIKESGFYKRKYKIYEALGVPYDSDNPFLEVSLNLIDTEILKKMLLPFIKRNITIRLTEKESKRVSKLFLDTYNEEGERKNGK